MYVVTTGCEVGCDIPLILHQLFKSPVVTLRNDTFNVPPTMHLCVLYGSLNKQRLFPYTALTDWFLYASRSVYCAVRTEYLDSILSHPSFCKQLG